jgi:hypothetical protein
MIWQSNHRHTRPSTLHTICHKHPAHRLAGSPAGELRRGFARPLPREGRAPPRPHRRNQKTRRAGKTPGKEKAHVTRAGHSSTRESPPTSNRRRRRFRQARRDFFKASPSGFPDVADLEDFFNERWGFSPDYAQEALA